MYVGKASVSSRVWKGIDGLKLGRGVGFGARRGASLSYLLRGGAVRKRFLRTLQSQGLRGMRTEDACRKYIQGV